MKAWIVRGAIVVVILSAVLSALYTKYYPAKHNKYYPNGQIFEKTTLINGVKNGPAVTYYANGALRSEDNYKNGLLDGEIKRYLEDGKYFSVNMFKNGLMEGLTVLYYPSGTVKARQMFKNNILDGLTQFYYEDGNIKEETELAQGVPNGMHKYYLPNGQLRESCTFKYGLKSGLFWSYSDSGPLKAIYNYENDRLSGLSEWYREDGTLKSVGNYKDGLADGMTQYFNESGVLESTSIFKEEKQNGLTKYYYSSNLRKEIFQEGQEPHYRSEEGIPVYRILSFVNGEPEGSMKYYAKDGTLLTSFVYNDGRVVEHTPFDFTDELVEAQDLNPTWQSKFLSQSIGLLFIYEDYDRIESLAAKYRQQKSKLPGEVNKLHTLYWAINQGFYKISAKNEVPFLVMLKRWEAKYPQSITQKTALMQANSSIAWNYRGGGFNSTVSEEGAKKFRKYIDEAYLVGKAALELPDKDPEFYSSLISASMEAGAPKYEVRSYFESGRQIAPFYIDLYGDIIRMSLPKWGGRQGEVESFIDWATEATKETLGSQMYAILWINVKDQQGISDLKNYSYSWDKLKASFDELLQKNRFAVLSDYVEFIEERGDKEAAGKLMAYIEKHKEDPKIKGWEDEFVFEQWQKWAKEMNEAKIQPPIFSLVISDDLLLVKKAIAETKNIDEQDPSGKTPLMVAISYHKTDAAILLIEKGAKVDVLDSSRRNALHYAAKEFSDKLFALIIEKGASANQIDQWGYGPIHYAAQSGYSNYVQKLMTIKNINVNGLTTSGMAPLHLAAKAGHIDVTNELLKSSLIDVNLQNDKGETPLHLAAQKGFKELAGILLAHSADKTIKDAQGKTAADYALENRYSELAVLLK